MGCDAPPPPPAAHSQDTKVSFHSFLFVTPPVPYYSVYLAYASSRARGLAPAGRNVPSCIQNPRQEFRFSASPSPFVSHIALLRIGRHPGQRARPRCISTWARWPCLGLPMPSGGPGVSGPGNWDLPSLFGWA